MILQSLKAIAETGRPPLGTRLMYSRFGLLEFVLPKRTRREHWPLYTTIEPDAQETDHGRSCNLLSPLSCATSKSGPAGTSRNFAGSSPTRA